MRDVLLAGGGLDSMAYFLRLRAQGVPFSAVHVDYGQQARVGEREAVYWFTQRYDVPLLTVTTPLIQVWNTSSLLFGTGEDPLTLGRNLGLVLAAVPLAERIHLGVVTGQFPDCNGSFVDDMNRVLRASFGQKTVVADLLGLSKVGLMAEAVAIEPEFFKRTFTCWVSTNLLECGRCRHCLGKRELERQVA